MRDVNRSGRRGDYLRAIYQDASNGERLRLVWLTGLRVFVGLCDLLLAAAMYTLFLLLQGRSLSHHLWWTPKTTLAAALATATLVIVRSLLEIVSIRSVVLHIQNLYTGLVLRLTRGYTELRWGRFVECNRSELLNITVNTAREASFFYHLCIELTAAVTVVIAMTCALIYQSPAAACGFVGTAGVFYVLHRFLIRQQLREAGTEKEQSVRKLQRTLADMFSSGKEIRTYLNQGFFYQRVQEQAHSVASQTLRLMLLPQIARILSDQGVVLAFLTAVVAVELRHGDVHRMLSVLVFYFVLSRRLLPLISQITFMAGQMEGSFECVQIVNSELAACSSHRAPAAPVELPPAGFVLELAGVSFAFDGRVAVLQDVHLRQRVAEVLIIRGHSGSGKSSLLNLIAGVSQPAAGTVRVDRENIAYVPQEIVLLDDSIRNNLLFGGRDKSEADLMDVLAAAKLDDFVAAQPMGLETRVGDNGVLLSGGQRQRLGLARALLRGVTLLLLDEATASLDEQSETQVLENLRKYGVAVLLVTHRVPAHEFADRDLRLIDGRLIEDARPSRSTNVHCFDAVSNPQ